MIIAVDYDGTLYDDGKLNRGLIAQLKNAQRGGDTVILWTCREGKTLVEALNALRGAGFCPTCVNTNAPETIQRLHRDSRKIFADVYIDDKAAPLRRPARKQDGHHS